MKIDVPANGCNVFYGTYIDNYYNNIRTRYYIHEGSLIKNNETSYSYSGVPTGAHCLTSNDSLVYRPQDTVYFQFLSMAMCVFAFFLLSKLIIKRLLP